MSTERFGIGVALCAPDAQGDVAVASNDSLQPSSYTMMPSAKKAERRGSIARLPVPTRSVNDTGADDTPSEARAQRTRSCRRLSITWHTQRPGRGEDVPTSGSGQPAVTGVRGVLCAVADRDDRMGTHRILDAAWPGELPAGEGVFYLRTPRGLYASEVNRLGSTAEALGAQFVEIHASTTANLQELERTDVRLDGISVHLAADRSGAGQDGAKLYPIWCAPAELEVAVYGIFEELLGVVTRPLTLHARWLPGAVRPDTGPPRQPTGDSSVVNP